MKKIISAATAFLIAISSFGLSAAAAAASSPETATIPIDGKTLYSAIPAYSSFETITQSAIADGSLSNSVSLQNRLQLCELIYDGISRMDETIDISSLNLTNSQESLDTVFCSLKYLLETYHHFFYCVSDYNIYISNKTGNFAILELVYDPTLTTDTYFSLVEDYKNMIDEIMSEVPKNLNDMGKMLFVYDYLALNYQYQITDNPDEQIHDAYNFMVHKMGVCQAYTALFSALMLELGIPCTEAKYEVLASDPETDTNHIWNIVKINDKYYHIDSTWADPSPDLNGYVSHDYFLLSDAKINMNGNHWHYYTNEAYLGNETIVCDDTQFDSGYIWTDSENAFAYYEGEFYYIAANDNLSRIDGVVYATASIRKTSDFLTYEDVTTIKSVPWDVTDEDNQKYYLYTYNSGISIIDSQIYYNTRDSIMYYDLKSGFDGIAANITVTDHEYVFYSLYSANGEFRYCKAPYIIVDDGCIIGDFVNYSMTISDRGNIDNDSEHEINTLDMVTLRRYLIDGDCGNICLAKCDLTGERNITVRDLVALKKILVNQ